jgi:hypothetical protein
MRKNTLYLVFLAIIAISACSSLGSGPAFESKEAMNKLFEELKGQYGQNPAFGSITIGYQEQTGNFAVVEGSTDINSEKMMQKRLMNGVWEDVSEITMEISEGKPADFYFTAADIDMSKIPDIVADAKKRVSTEKKIEDVKVTTVIVALANQVMDKKEDLKITVMVEPAGGGTTFTLIYDIKGTFKDMTY